MTDFRIPLETLKNQIIESSTYNKVDDSMNQDYTKLRNEIITQYPEKNKVPNCLKTCSTLSQIRTYFQKQASGYGIRRELIDNEFKESLESDNQTIDFDKTIDEIEKTELNILPPEIKKKGKEMAKVYHMLYCIENSLRIFIDQKFTERWKGVDYISKITVPISIKKSIQSRKDQEAKNAWLSLRGESDLFYLDFKDLGDLILNNWDIFKDLFPDQAWIKVKIDELGNCRNLISHNSYVNEHERNVINVNYISIVRQISK